MSELTPRAETADEAQTVRMPRVEPPLPGSLDPTRETADAESTAVLSIDDLMAPSAPSPTPASPTPSPAVTPVASREPATARPATRPATDRLRADAAAAWTGARRRTRTWLEQGDNAVIAATVAVAVLLFLVVGLG